ncbi:carbohydrate ABC transporter substrate-binding protein [Butyrivibrio sp. CB08]|uniref:ABC transporter substrate-binding protein n=1 Tax=Butyrivibrio sp. CB08 TaxID=2364879 RepID=UPI000EAA3DC1|nr:ABC transporter substrate-binding protein [Butyrivibrio sp. CB08]RKM62166.1 carbohydrate ABC transporter substrate-binding protein [Butyrivibrio sp. CB08]
MKKGALLLLAMAMCPVMLAGCGSQAPVEKTKVTFQTWNPADSGPDSPIYKIIDEFEKENPDIDVEYQYVGSSSHQDQLRVKLMGGEGPDVFGISAGASFEAFRDFEEDLTPFCKQTWGDNYQDKFLASCLANVNDGNGNTYGLPLGQTYAGYLWADVNMMKENGCEIPTNYSEMLETCKTLRANGQFPLAIGAMDSWLNLDMWMTIAADVDRDALYNAIDGKQSFESEPIIESLKIWQDSFSNGVFQDSAISMTLYNEVNDMFQREGSIPMFANGSWAMNMYTLSDEETKANFNGEGKDHDIFLIDWNDDGKVAPVTASTDVILCMNPESKVKDAAFKWMSYLVTAGQDVLVNQYLEYMPTLSDMELHVEGLSEDGQKNLEYIVENGKTNVAGVRGIQYAELSTAVCDQLEALALGDVTPEEAAAKIQQVSESVAR